MGVVKTLTIASGPQWKVVALCDNKGRCPTLTVMEGLSLEAKMMALMRKAATLGPHIIKKVIHVGVH